MSSSPGAGWAVRVKDPLPPRETTPLTTEMHVQRGDVLNLGAGSLNGMYGGAPRFHHDTSHGCPRGHYRCSWWCTFITAITAIPTYLIDTPPF